MKIIMSLALTLGTINSFALVGGLKDFAQDAVVSIYYKGEVDCSGSVVGLNPLTVLTAAHCLDYSKMENYSVDGNVPEKIIFGNKSISGMDLGIMVFKAGVKLNNINVKNIFNINVDFYDKMAIYRGVVEMCGFGKQDNTFFSSEQIGQRKCGQGLYLETDSLGDTIHTLYSKEYMKCYGLAEASEYKKINYSKILSGDSGGPLFIKEGDKKILVGVANTVKIAVEDKEDGNVNCGVPYGAVYQMRWASTFKSNPFAVEIFKMAKEKLGADIQGL